MERQPSATAQLLFDAVKGYVSRCLKLRDARIVALDARVAEVETRGISFEGVYQRAVRYRKGSVVTADGSLWCALRETEGVKPGDDPSAFQLIVKGR